MSTHGRKFTWFEKLTNVCDSLPDEYYKEMVTAITHYGTYGAEPQFSEPLLNCVFESVREDIDNSVNWREQKKKQARNDKGQFVPKPKNEETACETVSEPYGDRTDTVTDTVETVTGGNRPTIPYHSIPFHTKPNQDIHTT